MKTTIFLSSLLIGGSFFLNHQHAATTVTSFPAVKTTKARRTRGKIMPRQPISIVVSKSKYELYVYDAEGWFATYPVVFGNSSLEDKKMEGDRNTPEGSFRIVNKRVHEQWDRYMGLDYPTR